MTKHLQSTPQAARRELPMAQSIGLAWQPAQRRERTRFPMVPRFCVLSPLMGHTGSLFRLLVPVHRSANLVCLTKGLGSLAVRLNLSTGVSHD